MKRIAIVGSGIAGTSCAYYLNKLGHDVTLFEAGEYFGGHTNTIDINLDGKQVPIDTGFLVHNDRTYPNLIDFFNELGIETHPSDMSFSVNRISENLIWAGTTIFSVFCQLKNIFKPSFLSFLLEVLRFNKNANKYLLECKNDKKQTLGQLLDKYKYSENFRRWYLLPMGGCIWSTPTDEMLKFPAYTFLIFCMNHGLLQIFNRPQWKTVSQGCRTYVSNALKGVEKKYLNRAVEKVSYVDGKVILSTETASSEYDYCIFASHPPQISEILETKDLKLTEILKNFKYQPNKAVLHLDESILPSYKSAWAAWNYTSVKSNDGYEKVSVSYLINKLQPIPSAKSVIVSLNPVQKIADNKILKTINYEHPLFDNGAIKAQIDINEYQGVNNCYFAGAWMRYGFHEDGILSGKQVVSKFLKDIGSEETIEIL